MTAIKNKNRWGVLVKIEAPEGTYANPAAATDGVLVVEEPDVTLSFANDGARAHPTLKRVAKSGETFKSGLSFEPAGAGAAYSATVLPSLHNLLRLCGLAAAVDTTVNNEKVTYSPADPSAYAAGSIEIYRRGQKYPSLASHGQFKLEATLGGIPKVTVDVNGIANALPTDVALPAITYAGAQLIDPAKADAMLLAIGAWTPQRVKQMTLTQERGITARVWDNANSRHGGFNPGAEPVYTLEVLVEAEALATYNPFSVSKLASTAAFTAAFGVTGAYKRHVLTAANLQLVDTPEQNEDNAAMWSLKYELKPSVFLGLDHFAWAFQK